MQQFRCSVCQSTDSQFVRMYKHEWEVCAASDVLQEYQGKIPASGLAARSADQAFVIQVERLTSSRQILDQEGI